MGLFSWWRGGRRSGGSPEERSQQSAAAAGTAGAEAAAAHGAVVVRRQRQASDATVFEFGSAAESGAAVTLAGYCPVSDELEPCRWELVPAAGEGAPQFRIVF
uniref:Allyl alcohol dehydrogenase-like protein n=1 Tax=Arundo donax TaxID=35708 RepID=A0A0A9GYK5_ARUDO